MTSRVHTAGKQRGTVLIIALVFLLLITIVATTSVRFGALELLMSSNVQSRMESLQMANGISYGVIDKWQQNFVTDRILCGQKGGVPLDPRCDESSLVLAGYGSGQTDNLDSYLDQLATGGTRSHYLTQYMGETTAQDASVSAIAFNFQLEASFDNSARRQGRSEVAMGIQIINPVAGQHGTSPDGSIDEYVHLPTGD